MMMKTVEVELLKATSLGLYAKLTLNNIAALKRCLVSIVSNFN